MIYILYTSHKDKENIFFNEFFSGAHLMENNFDDRFAEQINYVYDSIKNVNMAKDPSLETCVQETLSSAEKSMKYISS